MKTLMTTAAMDRDDDPDDSDSDEDDECDDDKTTINRVSNMTRETTT